MNNIIKSLSSEARKYKSAEEFVKASNDTFAKVGEYAFGYSKEKQQKDSFTFYRKLMDYLSSPEVIDLYDKGLKDPQILTDFYNQAIMER